MTLSITVTIIERITHDEVHEILQGVVRATCPLVTSVFWNDGSCFVQDDCAGKCFDTMRKRILPKWTRNYDAHIQQWALVEFAGGDSRETSFHFSEHWWSNSALQQGSAMLWVRSWFIQFTKM
jgi:hypothetical protein